MAMMDSSTKRTMSMMSLLYAGLAGEQCVFYFFVTPAAEAGRSYRFARSHAGPLTLTEDNVHALFRAG